MTIVKQLAASIKYLDKIEEHDMLETLSVIIQLMKDTNANKLKGATYSRVFRHSRLTIDVQFDKEL